MQHADIVREELQDLAQRIADNIARNGQAASGKTQQSLHVEEDNESVTLYGRKAFGTMEQGRAPGRVPRNFQQILYLWSINKGIAFDDERERSSFAYLLARKIQSEGTKLFREGGRTDVYSNEIPTTIERIRKRISRAFKIFVESITLNKNEDNND